MSENQRDAVFKAAVDCLWERFYTLATFNHPDSKHLQDAPEDVQTQAKSFFDDIVNHQESLMDAESPEALKASLSKLKAETALSVYSSQHDKPEVTDMIISCMPTKFLVMDLMHSMDRAILRGPIVNEKKIIDALSTRAQTDTDFLSDDDVTEVKAHLGFDENLSPGDRAKLEGYLASGAVEGKVVDDAAAMKMYERLFPALGVDEKPLKLLRDRVAFLNLPDSAREQNTKGIRSWAEYDVNEQEAHGSIDKWRKEDAEIRKQQRSADYEQKTKARHPGQNL